MQSKPWIYLYRSCCWILLARVWIVKPFVSKTMGKSHKKKECAATITLLPSFWTGLLEENKDENPLQWPQLLWQEFVARVAGKTLSGHFNWAAQPWSGHQDAKSSSVSLEGFQKLGTTGTVTQHEFMFYLVPESDCKGFLREKLCHQYCLSDGCLARISWKTAEVMTVLKGFRSDGCFKTLSRKIGIVMAVLKDCHRRLPKWWLAL